MTSKQIKLEIYIIPPPTSTLAVLHTHVSSIVADGELERVATMRFEALAFVETLATTLDERSL